MRWRTDQQGRTTVPELPRGLYAVTPDESDTERLLAMVSAALTGGAAIVQYRNKLATPALQREQTGALLSLCRAARVPLIINDNLQLTIDLDADGVHLGGEDGDLVAARAQLGPSKLLGSSCYASIERALAARDAGADHIAFGAMFNSRTKPNARLAPLTLFADAHKQVGLPCVAIGGITLDNAPSLIAAGVHAIAIIDALFSAADVTRRARAFTQLF